MSENAGLFASPPPVSPKRLRELRKHVVNLNMGRFSKDGLFQSRPQDVAAIFEQHLPEWHQEHADTMDGVPPRVVLYAHGGLTNEAWGLHTASFQLDWWKENGVYPIFFVWETGLFETLRQIFFQGQRKLPFESIGGTRGRISDWFDELEDRGWEIAARRLGGPRIWAGMKESARSSFAEGGDGRIVLEHLKQLQGSGKEWSSLQVHVVGHSAGSIFHAYSLDAAHKMGLEKFRSLHLLAPAITADLFADTMKPLIGGGKVDHIINQVTVYTMTEDLELDDTVGPYDKSLLYMIYYALEPERETDLLGLEVSLNEHDELAEFFGRSGHPSKAASDIVFSKKNDGPKNRRSASTTHGGFDNDRATMESVIRQIAAIPNHMSPTPFPTDRSLSAVARMEPLAIPSLSLAATPTLASSGTPHTGVATTPARPTPTGNRKAVCIGINNYAQQPLAGCVRDAEDWQKLLASVGYSTRLLSNELATRDAILRAISDLIGQAREGDSIVIQFAGHGTQVHDVNGDELNGDTPGKDEALVPIDYLQNGLVLDDDLAHVCEKIRPGVHVVFLMDCCHSGTNTRMFIGGETAIQPGQRARFMRPTDDLVAAHERTLKERPAQQRSLAYRTAREVLLAACQSNEVAYETNGRGDFTSHAVEVLGSNPQLIAEEFLFEVRQRFGAGSRQSPGLWCAEPQRRQSLLGLAAQS